MTEQPVGILEGGAGQNLEAGLGGEDLVQLGGRSCRGGGPPMGSVCSQPRLHGQEMQAWPWIGSARRLGRMGNSGMARRARAPSSRRRSTAAAVNGFVIEAMRNTLRASGRSRRRVGLPFPDIAVLAVEHHAPHQPVGDGWSPSDRPSKRLELGVDGERSIGTTWTRPRQRRMPTVTSSKRGADRAFLHAARSSARKHQISFASARSCTWPSPATRR